MSTYFKKHIKAVVFDFDDTLVGTIEAKWAAHKYVAKKYYNKELTDDDIWPHWGVPLRTLVGLLYGDKDIGRAMEREAESNSDFPKRIFADTIKTLQNIKSSDKYIGIVTATSRRNLEKDLVITNIPKELIDYTQTEDDTNYHKPDPRVFEPTIAWLRGLSIKPSEVIYIGDGLHDMKAALGVGFEFLGVETGLVTAEQFSKENAKSISSLSELYEL
jgi:phosphoglycolate phosphatase